MPAHVYAYAYVYNVYTYAYAYACLSLCLCLRLCLCLLMPMPTVYIHIHVYDFSRSLCEPSKHVLEWDLRNKQGESRRPDNLQVHREQRRLHFSTSVLCHVRC